MFCISLSEYSHAKSCNLIFHILLPELNFHVLELIVISYTHISLPEYLPPRIGCNVILHMSLSKHSNHRIYCSFILHISGNKVGLNNGLTELLSLSNVHIVNVKEPAPGNWRLRVSSTGPHTVRVTGLSTADFVTGFSKYPTKDISQTSLRPIQGE